MGRTSTVPYVYVLISNNMHVYLFSTYMSMFMYVLKVIGYLVVSLPINLKLTSLTGRLMLFICSFRFLSGRGFLTISNMLER